MNRPDLRCAVTAAMAEGARWLLAAIGTAMGAPAPACRCRTEALDRAVTAIPDGDRCDWVFADAALVNGVWICVLEDTEAVYLIDVSVFSGAARLLGRVSKAPDPGAVAAEAARSVRDIATYRGPSAWRGGKRCRAGGIGVLGSTRCTARGHPGHPRSAVAVDCGRYPDAGQ